VGGSQGLPAAQGQAGNFPARNGAGTSVGIQSLILEGRASTKKVVEQIKADAK
jgi:hypothetical protein